MQLVVDMFGCPNRCRHCWLGHMPNRKMEESADLWIINYFKPYFRNITYYSWLREPDFCDNYRERWDRDNQLSINVKPMRFELASFWRIVRDSEYVHFLKDVGIEAVQLTFFGTEMMTDQYIGRKGAFQELLKATEILITNQIAPRWQIFINEENIDEVVQLLKLTNDLELNKRCSIFGKEFKFFVHAGSCDGENRKLYNIRIGKKNIPEILIPYYLDYDKLLSERKCCEILKADTSHVIYHNEDVVTLNIANNFDVYFNFTHMTKEWKIGNLKADHPEKLIHRIVEEDTPALNMAKSVTIKELVSRYGNQQSDKVFFMDDYKSYLLNCYLEDALN